MDQGNFRGKEKGGGGRAEFQTGNWAFFNFQKRMEESLTFFIF
jgi:hypothetical protein